MRDVQATSGDVSSHQDGRAAGAEAAERLLALGLRAVAMNGGRREAVAHEEVLQRIGAPLGLDKHQRQALCMKFQTEFGWIRAAAAAEMNGHTTN